MSSELGDYYREHGESEHVQQIRDVVNGKWQSRKEIGYACGKVAVNNLTGTVQATAYVGNCLEYLIEQGEIEKRKVRSKGPRGWKYVYRKL